MNPDTLIALGLVVLAALYLVRKFFGAKSSGGCDCSSGGCCASASRSSGHSACCGSQEGK